MNLSKILFSLVFACAFAFANKLIMPNGAPKMYPSGELGKMVKLGEDILKHTDTNPLTKNLVGNTLKCVNCHLAGEDGKPGTSHVIGTLIGTAVAFPAYSSREKTVQSLQDRINNCFMRSLNGKRPIVDDKASMAMAAYVTWLSTGIPIKQDSKRPCSIFISSFWAKVQKKFVKIQKKATHKNYLNGQKIFLDKCAVCHEPNGNGNANYPALWGRNEKGQWLSYNAGAGLSKLNKAPAWIQANMPFGNANTLSDQDSADVALYIDAQPRASFDLKKHLPQKGDIGFYNSAVFSEKHSVQSNFKAFGLNLNTIRGDKKVFD